MSEQEKKSGGAADSSVVLVEQSATSRHKQPIRTMEMQEDAPPKELHHKRSKAPAVPSLTEETKDSENKESKVKRENEHAVSSEKHKHNVAKKLSSVSKRRSVSPESIVLTSVTVDAKKESVSPSQPIPPQVSPSTADSSLATKHRKKTTKEDEESASEDITEDIAELRTPEVAKLSPEWSDEEEAGGLPRSESRASRVSRAVRQLFCCGVPLDPPSEHDVSPRTEQDGI